MDLQPAVHDDPDGARLAWAATDFGPDDYTDPETVKASTELVSDGAE